MALTIMADDLTGACDAGTLFAGRAPVPVTVWPAAPVVAEVAVVDTESRHIDREAASARVSGAAASRPAATSWFKKIDSTLRGHVGAEIVALLEATGAPSAVTCPAFPSEGRVVLDRVLWVDGAATAHVVDVIRSESDRPLAREAARLLAAESFDLIVLIGGDTAVAFYRTLDAMRIDLVGAPRPGLAFGYVRAPGHPVLPVLTKAGGFGPPGLFVSLWKEAAS